VRVIGISVDPPETNLEHSRTQGYTFPFLSDPNAEVIRRYDLAHEKAGPGGSDISRPAEFLIDATGTVRWANLTDSFTVRARPEQVLQVVDELGLAATSRK
jgi:peroxiredoxin